MAEVPLLTVLTIYVDMRIHTLSRGGGWERKRVRQSEAFTARQLSQLRPYLWPVIRLCVEPTIRWTSTWTGLGGRGGGGGHTEAADEFVWHPRTQDNETSEVVWSISRASSSASVHCVIIFIICIRYPCIITCTEEEQ